jgi:biopolymer transport protein ExbD
MKIQMPSSKKARIEILPLIDIVFLLLVFFIYAMLSMAVHRGLPVDLPLSHSADIDQKLTLSVTIKDDGRIFVDNTPVELEDLTASLRATSETALEFG